MKDEALRAIKGLAETMTDVKHIRKDLEKLSDKADETSKKMDSIEHRISPIEKYVFDRIKREEERREDIKKFMHRHALKIFVSVALAVSAYINAIYIPSPSQKQEITRLKETTKSA